MCNALQLIASNHMFKVLTAVVSFLTSLALIKIIPLAFALPGQLASLDDENSYESNLRIFNQTLVLCTRNLTEPHLIRLSAETLKYMFPANRLAIVEKGVQVRHGLHEVYINDRHVILVEPDLYNRNSRFFNDVARQIAQQQTEIIV